MELPLALAVGVPSGATAGAGLVTAIIGGVFLGALGGSSFRSPVPPALCPPCGLPSAPGWRP
ncbi:MAG TPA: hypothetical protein VNM48_18075 [Chloroflexota bacterium]|nr:hypothetical protein [Chloroflexota bacterium]